MSVPGKAVLLLSLQVTSAAAFGWPVCCGNPMGGTCADGSVGGPCCGVGGCNVFCCSCDGGCRDEKPEARVREITRDMENVHINQWPMLMAHDAATTYAKSDTCSIKTPVNNWAVTQPRGGFDKLLGCGARALDFRPYLKKNGELVMHHGAVVFDTPASEGLEDVVDWVSNHPGSFVVIVPGHCASEEDGHVHKCIMKTNEALKANNINIVQCSELAGLKVGHAMKRGKQGNGGSVIAVWAGCVTFNWDEDISCYGQARKVGQELAEKGMEAAEEVKDGVTERRLGIEELGDNMSALWEFCASKQPHDGRDTEDHFAPTREDRRLAALVSHMSCYGSDHDREVAFKPFWKYMDSKTNTPTPPHENQPRMWVAQAHWQYDTESIAEGAGRHSCILWDTQHSRMNKLVKDKVKEGAFRHINFIEVDHTCDHGHELSEALHDFITEKVSKNQEKFEVREGLLNLLNPASGGLTVSAVLAVCGLLSGVALMAFALLRGTRARSTRTLQAEDEGEMSSLNKVETDKPSAA